MYSPVYISLALIVLLSVSICEVSSQQQQQQSRSRTRNQQRTRTSSNDFNGRGSSSNRFPLAYVMASGVEDVVRGGYSESFSCEGRDYGYYSDIANNCQIYHICVPPRSQYTFFCNNGTVFDQKALTCVREEDSVPCGQAERYYALNSNFGVQDTARLLYID